MKKARNSCSSDESDGAAGVPSWLPPPTPPSSFTKPHHDHHHHHRPPPHRQHQQPPQLKSRSQRFSSASSSVTSPAAMTPAAAVAAPAAAAASSTPSSHRPAEVYRKDLISAMKVPDSAQLSPDEYYVMADAWKPEWEKGVQVPVCGEEDYPEPSVRILSEREKAVTFVRTRKYIQMSDLESPTPGYADLRSLIQATCHYDLDDTDLSWLHTANRELQRMGEPCVEESSAERVLERLERCCQARMAVAMDTVEGLGIEYDEDVVCDVCRSPDCEEANEMVFCDRCNVCVHQACYGILKVPDGSWLCRSCALGVRPPCLLCPKTGGAMKPTRSGSKWAHVSCALWIPEVSIGCPERMEPVTKISQIPPSRWALVCTLCRVKTGACIQCSVKSCITAFHVTCAFEHGLEMRTTLEEGEEVRFRSICAKHSKRRPQQQQQHQQQQQRSSGHGGGGGGGRTEDEKTSLRKQKLQELQEEFFTLAGPGDELAQSLCLPEVPVDLLFQYWKLKRRASFSRPLMDPPPPAKPTALGRRTATGKRGARGPRRRLRLRRRRRRRRRTGAY